MAQMSSLAIEELQQLMVLTHLHPLSVEPSFADSAYLAARPDCSEQDQTADLPRRWDFEELWPEVVDSDHPLDREGYRKDQLEKKLAFAWAQVGSYFETYLENRTAHSAKPYSD